MRLCICIALLVTTVGCQTTDSRSRREIALLRAEILDLEDQYVLLQSRCQGGFADNGLPSDSGVIGSGYLDESYYTPGADTCSCEECGRVIEGQFVDHSIQHAAPSPIIYEDTVLNAENSGVLPQQLLGSQTRVHPHTQSRISPGGRTATIVDPIGQPFDDSFDSLEPNNNDARFIDEPISLDPFNEQNQSPAHVPAIQPTQSNWVPSQSRPRRDQRLDSVVGDQQAVRDGAGALWRQASTSIDSRRSRQRTDLRLSESPLDGRPSEFDDFERLPREALRRPVRQIFIDPEQTYGKDFDNDGQQDGIALLIQPLDELGDIVPQASELVVSVIDPSEIGQDQRIGLWKFDSYQVESFVSNQRGVRGLFVELPWQRRVPENSRLLIFVRYLSSDGTPLETSLDVQIDPPDAGTPVGISDDVVGRPRRIPATAGRSGGVPKWRPVR